MVKLEIYENIHLHVFVKLERENLELESQNKFLPQNDFNTVCFAYSIPTISIVTTMTLRYKNNLNVTGFFLKKNNFNKLKQENK